MRLFFIVSVVMTNLVVMLKEISGVSTLMKCLSKLGKVQVKVELSLYFK
jgi:hypothetical protein